MNVLHLFAALALAQPAPSAPSSQPSSQPASGAQGTSRDVNGDLALVIEIAENDLSIQENWTLSPAGGKQIPAAEIRFFAPENSKLLRMDQEAQGFRVTENMRAVEATAALTSQRTIAFGYLLSKTGSSALFTKILPVPISGGRIIVQDLPDLSVKVNVGEVVPRKRDLNGLMFAIYDLPPMSQGADLSITLRGIPSKTKWPKFGAAGVALAIIGWMIWALVMRAAPGRDPAVAHSPVSAMARRDQIVKAIEVLERDLAAEKVKPKKFERRHSELMKELALVLREIELSERRAS
jgi:hypothetical protein